MKKICILLALVLLHIACSDKKPTSTEQQNLTSDVLENPVAYIPPQCYTNPVSENATQNPCYVCHTDSKRPNFLNDSDVQLSLSFPEPGETNHWSNLFKDRSRDISKISDSEILKYVRDDNYLTEQGTIAIADKLKSIPPQWDRNQNGKWDGYIPDAYFNFDDHGFDQDFQGNFTGWRVFAYYPFPGTFMPTNGSTDDVLIRLPKPFQQNSKGNFDVQVYRINLAIVEAIMKEKDIPIFSINEKEYGVDLDKNGSLSTANHIAYKWNPRNGEDMHYVGKAKQLQDSSAITASARLFPVGTEFLHSVRYLDTHESTSKMAKRMKELRYAKKISWRNYYQLENIVFDEMKERHDFPDRTKTVVGDMETGLTVAQGWTYQGFIEDSLGELRPQTYEETYFCTGCHGGSGAANDTIISFNRKFDHGQFKDGWYHWFEKGLSGIKDPIREDGHGEYAFYLQNNPTGNEYRNNYEVLNTFFSTDGAQNEEAFKQLAQDISFLLMPSKERAIQLNKAYKIIVGEQSYIKGRDPVSQPLETVHKTVKLDSYTGINETLSYY